jgi:uncharacterized membrane protein
MSVMIFLWQMLLGVPFIVFAYWYQREEGLYRVARPPSDRTMFRHAWFGLFFGFSFAILGLLFFPPITGLITLISCVYIFMRALDNIEYDKVAELGDSPQNRG